MYYPRSLILPLTSLLVVVGFIPGCMKSPGSSSQEKSKAAQTIVSVQTPQKKTIHWSVEQPATIQAYETTPIIAKVPGYISRVLVDIDDKIDGPEIGWLGEEVKQGTLLAELSIPELEEERKQKLAEAVAMKAMVEVAQKNLLVAEANIKSNEKMVLESESALAKADANSKRWSSEASRSDEMVARRVMDKQTAEETRNQAIAAASELDEAKARVQSAKARLTESQAKQQSALSDITAAEAKARSADAEARRVAALRRYAYITAPYKGIVTARNVHTGHFLQMNSSQPLFMVARLDPIRIFMEVPEAAASQVGKGSPAQVTIPSISNAAISAKVTRTAGVLNPDIRTLRVEIDLPNPDFKIRPGLYATVSLPIETPNAYTVPGKSTFMLDEFNYCFIVEEGKAVRYQVELGHKEGDEVELLMLKKADPKSTWHTPLGNEQVVVTREGPLETGTDVQVK
ncbi:efflux RND transporter periplasmic adaptor subunit [Telmatocola sphagniphila]|uniref:Efflux RND transporter periplasmic adaptor subunit n=1 Tax=Telmatocola sphagniphila TaxID=1123043 RepID=A0A8E6F0H5_9BACT|nr:efflux RND transporter periplasmic adaptor subunit [Telmatocola sphagniphila]QVL34541.1 efflux RND transporter periplasmic adaptor subunit [Telmatocola sphagniphila]